MFIGFVEALRRGGIPASLKEHLLLLEALDAEVIAAEPEQFYYLARATFVHDESQLDRFDRVFAEVFKGLVAGGEEIRAEHSRGMAAAGRRALSDARADGSDQEPRLLGRDHAGAEGAARRAAGPPPGRQQMDRHRRHLAVRPWRLQSRRRAHRRRRAGTAARSRCGRSASSATSTATRELGTRNIKVALRRLRRFAREGAAEELDLDGDDRRHRAARLARRPAAARAAQCGQAAAVPRHRRVDGRPCAGCARSCSRPAAAEFKHLEHFYFHNCIYEGVWKDNRRRHVEKTPTLDVIHKFGHDHKLVIVGDAAMSPYEITHAGGSIEHFNEEAGRGLAQAADRRLSRRGLDQPDARAILGPQPFDGDPQAADGGRMYPLTLDGLDEAMRELSRKR